MQKSSRQEEQLFHHEVVAGEMYVTDTAEKCVSQMCIWQNVILVVTRQEKLQL